MQGRQGKVCLRAELLAPRFRMWDGCPWGTLAGFGATVPTLLLMPLLVLATTWGRPCCLGAARAMSGPITTAPGLTG